MGEIKRESRADKMRIALVNKVSHLKLNDVKNCLCNIHNIRVYNIMTLNNRNTFFVNYKL